MPIPNYIPFNVANAGSDIQQVYASTKDHSWLKEQASKHNVRMAAVLSATIDHAQTSNKAFKRLLELLKMQDDVLAQGGVLPTEVTEEIHEFLEAYGE